MPAEIGQSETLAHIRHLAHLPFRTTHGIQILIGTVLLSFGAILSRQTLTSTFISAATLPLSLGLAIFRKLARTGRLSSLYISGASVQNTYINEQQFPDDAYFQTVITCLDTSGPRSAASEAHEKFTSWINGELATISGLSVEIDEFELLRWRTADECSLKKGGSLIVNGHEMDIAGAVPYSSPCSGNTGQLIFVDRAQSLSLPDLKGKIIVRELPNKSLPMLLGSLPAYSTTSDMPTGAYNRPSFWEIPMHQDLINAGKIDAAGLIFVFDFPREQMELY